ncbi:hypothetical protein PT974_10580 [Cladobotryum mycophilum]|uniref:CFEM domain-containing protein n=1 Tax=Cladobotryum mycophilum TaxID=491253 RepID=A0ABR0SA89_9HYPO
MKPTVILSALLTAALGAETTTTASGRRGVSQHRDMPKCAIACIKRAGVMVAGCKPDDTACFCQNFDRIMKNGRVCSERKCGAKTHVKKVVPAAIAICISRENETPPGANFEMMAFRQHERQQLVDSMGMIGGKNDGGDGGHESD